MPKAEVKRSLCDVAAYLTTATGMLLTTASHEMLVQKKKRASVLVSFQKKKGERAPALVS
jgi:hypothetical protein